MDLIKNCDECELDKCINCEHSWSDVQELKKQLEEKDKETLVWKDLCEIYKKQCHQFLRDIDMCYERINKLKNQVNDYQQRFKSSEKKYKQLIQSGVECVNAKNKNQNQKAIEELEKVKKNKFAYKYLVVSSKYLIDFINNRIKELKEE